MATYSDLFIDRGSSFESTVYVIGTNGAPMDLTGFLARGKIRKTYTSTTSYDLSCVISEYPEKGEVIVSLTPEETLVLKSGRYVYDVEVYHPDSQLHKVSRVVEGQVIVSPSVIHGS